jgi:hypothetical protein
MTWTHQQNVDDRTPINRNNYENGKVIDIDVSDVIKLLKYMNAGISRFSIPIHEKMFRPF